MIIINSGLRLASFKMRPVNLVSIQETKCKIVFIQSDSMTLTDYRQFRINKVFLEFKRTKIEHSYIIHYVMYKVDHKLMYITIYRSFIQILKSNFALAPLSPSSI